MYKVLLVTVAGFFDSTGEIPFMFKRAGCYVDVFCDSKAWLRSNNYYDRWIESSRNHHAFKDQLIALVQQDPEYYNWIVLLDDITVDLMNRNITSEVLFKKILPLTGVENREILSSKLGLSHICERYGISTPRFINYSEMQDVEAIKRSLKFPILLKEDLSFSGIGIQQCDEPEQLQDRLDKARVKEGLVLQEFVTGVDIGVEALFKDGVLISYNCADMLAYMYNKFSFTTRRDYYQNEDIANHLSVLGRCVGINGFASIQYIYAPERKIYYLVEVDIRTNSWMPYSRFTVNDFSEGIKRVMAGDITYIPTGTSDRKIEVAIFDRDIRRCMKFRDYKGMLQWMVNYHGYWKFIPIYDMKIFRRICKKLFKDLFNFKNQMS